jgi:hypothetical protein
MPTMRPQWAFYSLFLGWAAGRAAARCHHSGMSESSALADLRMKMINKNIALAICGSGADWPRRCAGSCDTVLPRLALRAKR